MVNILVSVFLGACTYTDVRRREIPVLLLWVFGGAGILWLLWNHGNIWGIAGCVPGLLLLGVSCLTGQIGKGDGWMLMIVGSFLGLAGTVQVLMIAAALCAAAGILLKLQKRQKPGEGIPFAPFLLAAYWITLL